MGFGALCPVLILGLLAWSTYGQSCTLITSNVLRVDSEETFVVDGHGIAFDGDIIVHDFPKKKIIIAQSRIFVKNITGFLGSTKFLIPSTKLDKNPERKQFVYVILRSGPCNLEKVVLLSYQSGYIFVQTDKPIYTPGSQVLYRIYSMTPDLRPTNKSVVIEVLTPENVIVQTENRRPSAINRIISGSYRITELASFGVWTVAAKFEGMASHYTAHFEVKEYVLPSFEVKITANKKYYSIEGDQFSVKIEANYLYGKPVQGMAYVLFSVTRDGETKSLPNTLTRIQIQDGEGPADLNQGNLEQNFQQKKDMLQWRLSVSATVITDSGSDMVEGELTDIHMVYSPYKVLFTKTSKFFKAGMPMDIMVFVTNPDGSPAHRIPVVVEPGSVNGLTLQDGTVRLSINTPSNINFIEIKVTTADPNLLPTQQANAFMTASAYKSLGGNYLHLDYSGGVLNVGDNARINFFINNSKPAIQNQITHFNYIILNKGRILSTGRLERAPGQSFLMLQLPIKPEFIPSFRILAYYVVSNEEKREIVADSVWIDVADTCMGTLTLSGEQENTVHSPGNSKPIKLILKADHKANVGLVAVDKGVYVLNNKYKISQTKVWDSVEKHDTGCTAGGGADAAGVFFDAGLALGNNFHGSTPQRSESLCQVKFKRRRRHTAALVQTRNTKASIYEGLEKMCCQDGMRDLPMKVSCERRSRNIADGEKCIKAFLDCCRHIEKKKETEDITDEFARSDQDSDYIDDREIASRSDFPESWLWNVETMSEARDADGISSKSLSIFLKDSITTWEVLAVSLSETKGICVSNPHNIHVRLTFFIDLRLPYAVIRNEQVEIRAILYNYGNSDVRVRVEWTYNEEFCSLSTAKAKYRQFVYVKAASSLAIPFIIIPLTLGYHDVEVKAAGQFIQDGVKKKLKVVPEGRQVVQTLSNVVLEPEGNGRDGVQKELIKTVDIKNVVPNTNIETIVTVQGTAVSQMVEKAIEGGNLNHLITAPGGCGEQNMMRMTPTVIATHYLDVTGQWEKIDVQRRTEALQHIKNGLATQLTFRKPDASYAAWMKSPASTWLTAYVVKVFALAQDLIDLDKNLICDPVKWLILTKQKSDGLFEENAPVYHQEMVGGITKGAVEQDSTLTAFILIALLESNKSCNGNINILQTKINLAIEYIQQQYPNITKPYTIAITSYALARAGKLLNIEKLMSACTDNHWLEPGSNHLSLEATSYALLTLVKMEEYDKAAPVVRWLTEQKFHGEVWGSTQSTIMIFQAIAQYYQDVPSRKDLVMDVFYTIPGRTRETRIRLNNQNALKAHTEQTQRGGDFEVTAIGKGQGTLSVFSVYYALETEREKQCNNFDLSLKVQNEPLAKGTDIFSTVSLTICTRYLKSQDSGMAILQVSMMTGFAADTKDLDNLQKRVDRYISNFEFNKGAFDKSTLILYIDKISHTEDLCLKFNLNQYFEVGLIQPATVTVYDYYSPESRCTRFYHIKESSKLLSKICQGEMCRCAEGNCFMQQQLEKVDANVRLSTACGVSVDYVYKTTLSAIVEEDNYSTYEMTITLIIKEGTDVVQANHTRNFISHSICRDVLNLQMGQDYVVWGVSKDMWNLGAVYSYMVTKDTWIELWPNVAECQQNKYKTLCEELSNFSDKLRFSGCPY